jgi:hypothetical protein
MDVRLSSRVDRFEVVVVVREGDEEDRHPGNLAAWLTL